MLVSVFSVAVTGIEDEEEPFPKRSRHTDLQVSPSISVVYVWLYSGSLCASI